MKIIEIQHHSRAHGVVVSHPLSMREALGSIPSVSRCKKLGLGGAGPPKRSRGAEGQLSLNRHSFSQHTEGPSP